MEKWTKQCQQEGCFKYIPDEHILCDYHLLEKYELLSEAKYDTADRRGYERLIPADAVLRVLREAEQGEDS